LNRKHEPGDGRRALGAEGERRAADFLRSRGYRIIASNVRHGGVEVDLIARHGTRVAFVEVKTRRSNRFGAPELAVDANKQARLVRAALAWQSESKHRAARIRFDVVTCLVEGSGATARWRIRHWPDAFHAA
jgi:putative endonuclease